MDQLRRPEPVSRTLGAASFGFFTAEEARKLSVKRVVATEILDRQGNAVPDGLYDPAMGPTDPKGTCATCRLGYAHCPGHFGHIEMPLPVYNPLTFATVLRLLRAQCMHCGGFRMATARTALYARKLRLLARGRLTDALALSTAPKAKRSGRGRRGGDGEDAMEEDGGAEAEDDAAADVADDTEGDDVARLGPPPAPAWTSHSWGEARALMTAFLARQPPACENCGCRSPALSAEAPVKIHRKPLAPKARANNAAVNADVERELAAMWRELMAEVGGADAAAAAAAGAEDEDAAGDDEDEEEEEEEEAADDDMAAGESDSDDAPAKKPKAQRRPAATPAAAAAGGSGRGRLAAAAPSGPAKLILLTPLEARALLRRLWRSEPGWLSLAYAADADVSAAAVAASPSSPPPVLPDPGCLFMQTLLVPPNKLRPPSRLGEMTFEHPQNEQYKAILVACSRLADHFRPMSSEPPPAIATSGAGSARAAEIAALIAKQNAEMDATPGGRAVRAVRLWLEMQGGVVRLLGAGGGASASGDGGTGIRQQLERKQGLFRMNMMGKRVNYAARSVISPDPFLAPGQIGVPPFIARKLTFPELVTPHNVEQLRAAVMAGPEGYPGATAVENEAGRVVQLAQLSEAKRAALAKSLLAAPSAGTAAAAGKGRPGAKAVYRHLIDGDVLLTNRQPTLHKPGVMAHRARVLAGQRTIRMHYANCATFNADFDGDEINLHLPQEHHGRAEAYGIVAADAQFCVPTDGKPIRGLIQDHVVAGVLLTQRGTFLTREQFSALLYAASLALPGGMPRGAGALSAVGTAARPPLAVHAGGLSLRLPPPCVLKPCALWSGKQLLTALLALLADGRPPLTASAKGKVPDDYWGPNSGEESLVVHRGDVVSGVLDKNAFAKFGLVHSVAELYGANDAGRLLAALSRLLTAFLAEHGFTCGVDDMQLTPEAEAARKVVLQQADGATAKAAEEFAFAGAPPRDPALPPRTPEEVRVALVSRLRERAGAEAGLDAKSTGPLNKIASQTIKTCLPRGQVKPFPRNCLSLMTVSGAKGGPVNFAQISALLGQQELEGRRVPRLPSGKTLPSFSAWDAAARAGGFIGDRFLTGIRPQEYYFHCMAGREGLVDTAVKTSRSGYLQRCLVKNLEALRVSYDGSVRDCDGGVVQFHYGEDGVDVTRTGYSRQFGFLAANAGAVAAAFEAWGPLRAAPPLDVDAPDGFGPPGLPAQARWRPACTVGAVGEAYRQALDAYVAANPEGHLLPDDDVAAAAASRKSKSSKTAAGAIVPDAKGRVRCADFVRLMELRHMAAAAAPGEAVGVLAAQSVGEPSTQMTLNTFHFAGRGEANVTLGIPRLRELLMAAARRIGTPVMTLPTPGGEAAARAVAARLRRVTLAELLTAFTVVEQPFAGGASRRYTVRAVVRHAGAGPRPRDGEVGFDEISDAFRAEFCRQLFATLKLELRRAAAADVAAIQSLRAAAAAGGGGSGKEDEGEGGGTKGDDEAEEGGAAAKRRARGREAAAEVGEVDGDEDGEEEEEEEGAKADARRGARAGEGYTEADDADAAAAERRKGGAAPTEDSSDEDEDQVVPPAKQASKARPVDDDDMDEDESDDASDEAPAGRPLNSGDALARARAALMTTLEDLADSMKADAETGTLSATLQLRLSAPKLLLLALAQKAAAATAVRSTPGIKACYVLAADDASPAWRVQTDGINFAAAAAEAATGAVDAARIGSNDVYAVLQQFGVEAARATLLAEVRAVFGAYGIGVDPRHLSLIADAMTHGGGYRPCSRAGLDACPSPLLKMSFETATAFLTDATLRGATDDLHSPSSRLVLGRVVELGTGACGLQFDLPRAAQLHAQRLAAAV